VVEIVDHDPALKWTAVCWGADDSLPQDGRRTVPINSCVERSVAANHEMLLQENDDIFWISKAWTVNTLSKRPVKKRPHYLLTIPPQYCVSLRDGMSCTDVNTGPGSGGSKATSVDSKYGFVHRPAVPNCADNWELPQRERIGQGLMRSYDPSLDGVVCFKGHVVARDVKVAFPGFDYRSGRRCWWCSTIVTKFEMSFPKRYLLMLVQIASRI
jgi:hypothetical protein